MPPRIEFILLSSLLASALATLGYLCLRGNEGPPGDDVVLVLSPIVAAAVSAALGAFYATALHFRAGQLSSRWTPARLNMHVVLATLAIYPLAVGTGWAILELASDADAPSLADVSYVLMLGVTVGVVAVLAGAIPTFVLEYFACHRYLRRTAATTDHA